MADETLMTEATADQASAPAPEAPDTQTAPGAEQVGQPQQQQKDDADKVEGAPEKYEFKPPEGKEFSPEVLDAFSQAAREINLTQDGAQQLLDKLAPSFAQREANALAQARKQWAEDSRADTEIGGDKFDQNMTMARKALDQFGSDSFKQLLTQTGLGNHPEIIRTFVRIGKSIGEDGFVGGKTAGQQPGDARRLYSASNMNP